MKRIVVIETVAFMLIFLFVYTAVNKLVEFDTFTQQMKNQPLPKWLTRHLVWAVPGFEFIAASLLAFSVTRTKGLLISSALMLSFTVYVLAILLNAFTYIPCSCGGIFKTMSWEVHLVVNIILTILSFTALLMSWNAGRDKNIRRGEFA